MARRDAFTASDAALLLTAATWNPSGWSFAGRALGHAPGALAWAALAGVGFVLGPGQSRSHVRRRLSGQADVDDVDD